MNSKLIELIRQLSLSDSKTLSQKTLKSCEEVGELARVVLPFENAFACKHHFIDRRAILEEVADVILTVTSIAFNLDFEYEELEEMLHEKSLYWAELQSRDREAKFPVPYEIHCTVKSSDVEGFRAACLAAGVKPLLLDLQLRNGDSVMHDLITSSIHTGDNASVYQELNRIIAALAEKGFSVTRQQIETVPWHPAAPNSTDRNPTMPPNCYFESHLAVLSTEENLTKLREIAKQYDCHVSRNVFKKLENYVKIMVTMRHYDGNSSEFQNMAGQLKTEIESQGFTVDKLITEFCIYDTKISHDAAWLMT